MVEPNTKTTPARVTGSDVNDDAAEPDLCTPKQVIKNRWSVIEKLGGGCFGQLYTVKDSLLNRIEALKVESASKGDRAQLPTELQVLKKFQGKVHATELFGAGTSGEINFIIMQLVGDNLADLRRKGPNEPKHFSLSTSFRLSKQCLEAIQELHTIYVVHRDIKSSNFAIGLPHTPTKDNVFLLDFGLAKFFADAQGVLKPERKNVGFRGTMRYCSLAAHERKDLGRKDDLISHLYMTVEFCKGFLPWKGAGTPYEVVISKKQNGLDSLLPEFIQMRQYGLYLKDLQFESAPDYKKLLSLLEEVMTNNKISTTDFWDWENDYKCVMEEDMSVKTNSDNENDDENG